MYKYDTGDESGSDSNSRTQSDSESSSRSYDNDTDLSSRLSKLSITSSKTKTNTKSSSKTSSNSSSKSENYSKKRLLFKKHTLILKEYLQDPITKLSDFGNSVCLMDKIKPSSLYTIYYRPPEIILGLPYDTSSDIWALGCTIYELFTRKILFNPDKDTCDEKRSMIHQMYSVLGSFNTDMINNSPFKEIFFTNNFILKGFNPKLYHLNFNIFFNKCMELLITEPSMRTTAKKLYG